MLCRARPRTFASNLQNGLAHKSAHNVGTHDMYHWAQTANLLTRNFETKKTWSRTTNPRTITSHIKRETWQSRQTARPATLTQTNMATPDEPTQNDSTHQSHHATPTVNIPTRNRKAKSVVAHNKFTHNGITNQTCHAALLANHPARQPAANGSLYQPTCEEFNKAIHATIVLTNQ